MPYNTENDLEQYASERGITLQLPLDQLLARANDYIETRNYQGRKTDPTQANQWPRTGVVVDVFEVEPNFIPQEIYLAELQVAIAIDNGFDPLAVQEQAIKREKVGPLETEYQELKSGQAPFKIPAVNALLKPYLRSSQIGYDR